LAQLMAFLFLDGLDPIDTGEIGDDQRNVPEEEEDSGIPSELVVYVFIIRLTQISTDVSYGMLSFNIQPILFYDPIIQSRNATLIHR